MANRTSGRHFILIAILLLLVLGCLYVDVSIRDSYSGLWNSSSTTEARANGVLLQQYDVTPRVITFENYRAEFTDCWVEERTRTSHDFIFFPRVTKLGEPLLVLNYQGQRLTPDRDSAAEAMLVPGHEGNGQDLAESRYSDKPNRLAYHQFTQRPSVRGMLSDSVGNDTLYFSIIRKWSDRRRFQIKAYPRKQTTNAQAKNEQSGAG